MGKIWYIALSIQVCFMVCLSLFPGVSTSFQSNYLKLGDWFPIIMIFLFDLGDFIGKALPASYPIFHRSNAHWIFVPLFFHICWIPIFLLGVIWSDDPFWGNEYFYSTIVLLMGATNGFSIS